MQITVPARPVEIVARVDVLVVGAGSAGVAAAVAAAETGARTLILESSGRVGGTLVHQLLEHSAGFHDASGRTIIRGFGQRLVDRLVKNGSSPGHTTDFTGYTATRTSINHAEASLVETTMLAEAGAQLAVNALAVGTVVTGGPYQVLLAQSPRGPIGIEYLVVVDCTGDASVAAMQGAKMSEDIEATQPTSLLFKVAGVNFSELLAYVEEHPEEFRLPLAERPGIHDEAINLWGFGSLLAAGHSSGALRFRRTELHFAGWPRRGEAILNVTRSASSGLDALDLGQSLTELAAQVTDVVRWLRASVAGFTDAYLLDIASRVGVRETRRIFGEYVITDRDCMVGRQFPDNIAQCGFPLDVHDSGGPGLSSTAAVPDPFGIPLRALIPVGAHQLLVAGRPISSTHRANGSVRITGPCFATGEAAGVAAALAAGVGIEPRSLDPHAVRMVLTKREAILDKADILRQGKPIQL